eukprot:TRINITY_DN6646_c0_g1_i2.p1 TRINITY_DN6646_c0_g1~~TRINITY_DN6646_c0_g1_i2.p1  ORF type:complete len:473 (+),score=28.63 TRINITY_DN6646_c0_g1_i2:213-1631(+)
MQRAREGDRELMCLKCLSTHSKKSCKHPTYLLSYVSSYYWNSSSIESDAGDELLPRYRERLDNFEKDMKITDEAMREFFASSKIIKEGLFKIKAKLEGLLKVIDRGLELFRKSKKNLVVTKDSIKGSMTTQYEELKEAVESEDLSCIIEMLYKSCTPDIPDISDGGKQQIEALKKIMDELMAMEKLNAFSDLLNEFNGKHKLLIGNCELDTQKVHIYGICYPQKDYSALYRYDIQSKKLECLLDVPNSSSVAYISGRVFISGGSPSTNSTKEYVEKYSALFPKALMKYNKCNHTIQMINKNLFVAVGGYDTTYLSCCEEYSIVNDKWESIPSLNKPRCYIATVFLNNELLYAIGGTNYNNDIEVLNYSEKKIWTDVNIMVNEISFSGSPKALIISKDEILILSGNNTIIAGLWNIKANIIKDYPGSKLNDYYTNQFYVENGKGYILGYYRYMHIFDLDTRKFTELEYSSMFP